MNINGITFISEREREELAKRAEAERIEKVLGNLLAQSSRQTAEIVKAERYGRR